MDPLPLMGSNFTREQTVSEHRMRRFFGIPQVQCAMVYILTFYIRFGEAINVSDYVSGIECNIFSSFVLSNIGKNAF